MRLVFASILAVWTSSLFACAIAQPLDDPSSSATGTKLGSHDSGSASHVDSGSSHTDAAGSSETAPSDDATDFDSGTTTWDSRRDPFDTGADDTSVFGFDATGDPCTTCVNTACSSEESACMSETACTATMDCLSKCADPTCADGCVAKYPSPAFDAFMNCVGTKCATPCGGPPPMDAGPPPPPPPVDAGRDGP